MRPDDNQIPSSDPRGRVTPPERREASGQAAAANLVRSQLDSIYAGSQPAASQPQTQSQSQQASNPPADQQQNTYFRTHQASHTTDPNQWKKYHSAWQDYYQKYYEHYYVGAVKQVHDSYQTSGPQPVQQQPEAEPIEAETTTDEALYDLRNQLLDKVKESGKKARKSRHFVPIIAGFSVLMLFAFFQYNTLIIGTVKAYVSPGQIDPQNIVVDPNASLVVGPEPMIVIPKINVRAPVNYDATPDQPSQLKAMENGTAYFGIPGANSKPGQVGNTVISGHSSNDYFDGGGYKFVFALLERLQPGDIFYLHYEGTRYTYTVSQIRVVSPTDVSALVYPTTKPEVTLITCTPLGTALNRLLVTAEQVSPSPTNAAVAPQPAEGDTKAAMPGNAPTVFERIFGG